MRLPLISVVIATRNRSAWLKECLQSLARQTLERHLFEVVVINDGSEDDTGAILEDFKRITDISLVIVHQENQGVSYSRNLGIKKASGQIVAFTDDDCVLPPEWLESIVSEFDGLEETIAGVGGPLNSFTDSDGRLIGRFIRYLDEFNHVPVLGKWRVRPVHVSLLVGDEIIPYLRTSNAAFRRDCLLKVGGFDPEFRTPGGEDPDLSYRLMAAGYCLKFCPVLVVEHHTRDSFRAYFRCIRNYVGGEFRKSGKRGLYAHPSIRRSYKFLVCQKIASILLAAVLYPYSVLRAMNHGLSLQDSISFPLLLLSSKCYSLWIALQCRLGILRY